MKKKDIKKQDEIELLKTIIILCASFGAKKIKVGELRMLPKKSYRIFIDLPETALNIWTDDEKIVNALREMEMFKNKEETENERTENL